MRFFDTLRITALEYSFLGGILPVGHKYAFMENHGA
jgi:hypothetical protein